MAPPVDKLNLIRNAVPAWFAVTMETGDAILGTASVPVPEAEDYVVDLTIAGHVWVEVQETRPGTRIPRWCPNRHLNGDGTFCIGYRAQQYVTNQDRAYVWWGLLKEFLLLQRYAEQTGLWPPHKEMSHGDSAVHHIAALEAAKALGIGNEYIEMLMGRDTWFSSGEFLVDGSGVLAAHEVRPCPVTGCDSEKGKRDFALCHHLEAVTILVREEHRRREAEKAFWLSCLSKECCGTMVSCPLRDLQSDIIAENI